MAMCQMVDIPLLFHDLVFFLLMALVVNFITANLSVPYTLGLVIGFVGLTPEAQLSPELVLFVFLPALLFEGAWNAKLSLFRENWRAIFFLAGPGLLLSLAIIAAALHILDQLDWITALLLAAILSPTDPVAVLGLFRQLHVNERLSSIIEGESLFNDGVAGSLYQAFLALVLLSFHGQAPSGLAALGNGLLLFVVEAGGGLLFGAFAGFLISWGLRRIDEPVVETTITLLSAYGIYWAANELHLSAIVAVIVTALILGNYGRAIGMSERTRSDVDTDLSHAGLPGQRVDLSANGHAVPSICATAPGGTNTGDLAGGPGGGWCRPPCTLCARAGAHRAFVDEAATENGTSPPGTARQAAAAARLAYSCPLPGSLFLRAISRQMSK
jgi:CPA1 family monovalent cation:H+ antiporter